MIRRPPRSTLFPTRRSSDLLVARELHQLAVPEQVAAAVADLEEIRARPHANPQCQRRGQDRKSTRLNSSHPSISYAVFCLKKKKNTKKLTRRTISINAHLTN